MTQTSIVRPIDGLTKFMFSNPWQLLGKIQVIINQHVNAHAASSGILQQHWQWRLPFADLEARNVTLVQHAFQTQVPDELILRKTQRTTDPKKFFSQTKRPQSSRSSHQGSPPAGLTCSLPILTLTLFWVSVFPLVSIARRFVSRVSLAMHIAVRPEPVCAFSLAYAKH
jgi:hypothetical protein